MIKNPGVYSVMNKSVISLPIWLVYDDISNDSALTIKKNISQLPLGYNPLQYTDNEDAILPFLWISFTAENIILSLCEW